MPQLPEDPEPYNANNMTCKICLDSEESLDDPLISICDCIGTMKHIHQKCLQQWINTRMQVIFKNSYITIYNKKGFMCEICKSMYRVYSQSGS